MKKQLLSVLIALAAALATQAATFTKLDNANFNTLQTGDQVVLTYAFGGTIYAISAEEATSSSPATVEVTETDGKIEPDKTIIFTVGKVGENFTFNSGNNMLNINAGATNEDASKDNHIAVRVSVPNKSATCTWNLSVENYLYAEVNSVNQYIGVNQKTGTSTSLKVYNHRSLTSANIKDETFAVYYNRPNKVTLATVEGGTLESSMAFANKDDVVEISLTPAKGYDYVEGSLVYTYNDGTQDITTPIEDNQFYMPAYDVAVTAEFEGHEPSAMFDFTLSGNPWGLPTSGVRQLDSENFTYDSKTITLTGTGKVDNNGGYTLVSGWVKSYILFGKKNATLALQPFTTSVSKIVVTGETNGSAEVEMNILVGGQPASTPTIGSTDENIYLIARDYRAAGNQYALTILSDNTARISTIDIYGTVPGMPEAPDVSVPAGLYKSEQLVELSCITEGAKIYYTLDGSRPTETSTAYTTAIPVSGNLTIRAVAIKDGNKSEITTAKYAIAPVTAEGTPLSPYEVPDVQALNNPAWKAWVHGYIINGFEPNIKIRALSAESINAIAIAASATETDPSKMVFVELPQGKVRNALNIVDNPTLKGHQVWVYGVLSNYGGQPGVSKTSKYYLDEVPVPTACEQVSAVNGGEAAEKRLINGHLYIIYKGAVYDATGKKHAL